MQRVELSRGGNCWIVVAIQMRVDETTSDLNVLQHMKSLSLATYYAAQGPGL